MYSVNLRYSLIVCVISQMYGRMNGEMDKVSFRLVVW